MQPSVFFAIPTFTGLLDYKCTGALMAAVGHLTERGISSRTWFMPNLQFVDVARNFQVTAFLQDCPECTHLFFIDDDVGFPPEKVVEFVLRDEDIVAGVYPMRKDGPQEYPVMLNFDDYSIVHKLGLLKAQRVPMGFCCIRRNVIEKLAAEGDTYVFAHRDELLKTVFNVFQRGPIDGEYHGEDVLFCMKAIRAGFNIWVDPDIQFTHRGYKHWAGTFRNAVQATMDKDPRYKVVEAA